MDREVRMAFGPDPFAGGRIPTPAQYRQVTTSAGQLMNPQEAAGLPAVLDAILTVSESAAGLPLRVYQGRGAKKRERDTTWQWDRLGNAPNEEESAFDFWQDVFSSVECYGNAYILKIKTGPLGVDEMWLLDPEFVGVARSGRDGRKVFKLWTRGDEWIEVGIDTITHVRGPRIRFRDPFGVSPIMVCADVLGTAMARQMYEGYFYRHNASPGGALKVPDRMGRDKALEMVRLWSQTHGGWENAGLPAVLSGGADWVNVGVPLREAQFIEANDFTVADVARMYRLPVGMLERGGGASTEEDTRRFLNFGLRSRLNRVAGAVRADPDFFGSGEMYPQFFTDEFITADALTMSQVRHNYVQDGVMLVDEARAEMGYSPLPNGAGQVPQITPVGGAPNPNQQPPEQPPAEPQQNGARKINGTFARRVELARTAFAATKGNG